MLVYWNILSVQVLCQIQTVKNNFPFFTESWTSPRNGADKKGKPDTARSAFKVHNRNIGLKTDSQGGLALLGLL